MIIEIKDALLLGFDRSRHYFEGDVFARGDAVSMRVEGYLKDFTNATGTLSTSILTETKERLSRNLGETYNGVDGWDADDIKINGINYGKGRINSIESSSSPDPQEQKIFLSRYTLDLEFLEAIPAINFEIDGHAGGSGDGGSDPYKNIENTLEPYAHRLDQFNETFTFNKNSDGVNDVRHSLQIQYRPAQGEDPIAIAKTIARDIFENQRPDLPYYKRLVDYDHADYDVEDGDIFSESYDTINGRCNFTRSYQKFPEGGVGVIGLPSTIKRTYALTRSADGFIEINEKVNIHNAKRALQTWSSADQFLQADFEASYARCQSMVDELGYAGKTLINITVETSKFRAQVDGRLGYEVKWSSDPRISASGMKIDRKYDMARDAAGVVTVTSEHVATPLTKKKFSASHLAKAKTILEAGINNSIIYKHSGTLRKMQEVHNRSAYGSRYSIKKIDTDNPTILTEDLASLFSRKEINIDNQAPIRMHETYMISRFGEVIHISPQSQVGTLKISFKGTAKRNKLYNCFSYGQIYNQDNLVSAAATEAIAYFGSVLNPTQLFITDTTYSVSASNEVTFEVILQYTARALTTSIVNRT